MRPAFYPRMSFGFRFLGTGTSQGVPVIGREYPAAFLANPRNHRLRASIYVETPSVKLVVDTTPDFRMQMLREGLGFLDATIITHAHADHIMGMDDCRRVCEIRGGALPVFATEETLVDLRRIYNYAFDGRPIPRTYFHPAPQVIRGPFQIGDLLIRPFQLPHGRISTTGLVFEQAGVRRLAYYSDCKLVTEDAVAAAQGCEVVVLDALRRQMHDTHMCLAEALEVARRLDAGRTYLTHLTHDYDHDVAQQELPERVWFAYDGLRVSCGDSASPAR